MSEFLKNLTLNYDSYLVWLAFFGPLLVAAITGLNTPAKTKTYLSIGIVVILGIIDAALGSKLTGDVFADMVTIAVIWQSMYTFLWKNTIAKRLQEEIPIKIGE